MESESNSMKIETLSDSNYHSWKIRIQHVLALKDLEELLEEDPPTDTAALSLWKKKDKKSARRDRSNIVKRHARKMCESPSHQRNVDYHQERIRAPHAS